MAKRPTRPRSTPSRVERVDKTSDRCYLCGRLVGPTDKVVRLHEALMHQACYRADIEKGRTPGKRPRR